MSTALHLLLFFATCAIVIKSMWDVWKLFEQEAKYEERNLPVQYKILTKPVLPSLEEVVKFPVQGLKEVSKQKLKMHGMPFPIVASSCVVEPSNPVFSQALALSKSLYEKGCAHGSEAMEFAVKGALKTGTAICFVLLYFPDETLELRTFFSTQ